MASRVARVDNQWYWPEMECCIFRSRRLWCCESGRQTSGCLRRSGYPTDRWLILGSFTNAAGRPSVSGQLSRNMGGLAQRGKVDVMDTWDLSTRRLEL